MVELVPTAHELSREPRAKPNVNLRVDFSPSDQREMIVHKSIFTPVPSGFGAPVCIQCTDNQHLCQPMYRFTRRIP